MTEEQEDCFVKFFMPHGITPKQFEAIEKSAHRITIKKNEPIIKQGERLDHVYLVVRGSTRASILGRYLTAASTTPLAEAREGGASGAWVGEMSLLECYWEKEQGKIQPNDSKDCSSSSNRSVYAMYTVIAKEDCIVWRWSHEEMETLMDKVS